MVATGTGLTKQRREGDPDSGDAKTVRVYDMKPQGVRETGGSGRSSDEGEDRITSPEPRACGSVGGSNRHGCKVMASQEDINTWTKAGDEENAKERPNARTSLRKGRSEMADFQPYWGKPAVRNEWRGRRKRPAWSEDYLPRSPKGPKQWKSLA